MKKSKPTHAPSPAWRVILSLVLLTAAIVVLAMHWHTVTVSIASARHANGSWLVLALLLMALTYCIAAAIYGSLALHKLRYMQTLIVEVAASFVNRLLPSGLGGLGLHGVYLYKRKHTVPEATAVVSVNNLLGMVAHLLLLGGVVALYPSVLGQLKAGDDTVIHWQVGVILIALLAIVWALPAVRHAGSRFIRNLLKSFRAIRPSNVIRALALAMVLTVTYTLILFSTARALGISLGGLQVFIIFSIGMLAGTATPTPGGLLGAEAGLFAGFVAYGVSDARAGAAVLLYRLVTYWLPLLPGLVSLGMARSRKLV